MEGFHMTAAGGGRGLMCLQGKEPSVRQLALLHFRNAITLSVKLEDALARTHARVPPAIVQMLLVLQVRGAPRRPLRAPAAGTSLHARPRSPEAEPETWIWILGTCQWGDSREKLLGSSREGGPQPHPMGSPGV